MYQESRGDREQRVAREDRVKALQRRFMTEQVEGKREPRPPAGPLWEMYKMAAEAEGISEKDARDVYALTFDFIWSGFADYDEGKKDGGVKTWVKLPGRKNDFGVQDQYVFSFHGRSYVMRKVRDVEVIEKATTTYDHDIVREKSAQWELGVLDASVDYWKADDRAFREELNKSPEFHRLTSIPAQTFSEGYGSSLGDDDYSLTAKHLVNRAWQLQYLLGAWTGKSFEQGEYEAFVDKVTVALGPREHGYIPWLWFKQRYEKEPTTLHRDERGLQALQIVLILRMLDAQRPGGAIKDLAKVCNADDLGFRQAAAQYRDIPGLRMWLAQFTGESHESGHAKKDSLWGEEREPKKPAPEVEVVGRGPAVETVASAEDRALWGKIVERGREQCKGLRAIAFEMLGQTDALDRNPDGALRRQALIAGVIEHDASDAEEQRSVEPPVVRIALEDDCLWYPSAVPRIEAALALGAPRIVIVAPPDKVQDILTRITETIERVVPDFAATRRSIDALPNSFSFAADLGSGVETIRIAVIPAQFGKPEKEGGIPQRYLRIAPPGIVLGLGPVAPGHSGAELDGDTRLLDELPPGGIVLSDSGVRSARKWGNDPQTGRTRQQMRGPLQSYRTLRPFGINTMGLAAKDDMTFVIKPVFSATPVEVPRRREPWEPPRELKAHQSLTLPGGMKAVFEVIYDGMAQAEEESRGGILGAFPEAAPTRGKPHLRIIHEPTVKWSEVDGRHRVRPELGGTTTVVRTSMRVKGFSALMRAVRESGAGAIENPDGDAHSVYITGSPERSGRHSLTLDEQLRLIARCMTYEAPEASPASPTHTAAPASRELPRATSQFSRAPSSVPEPTKPATLTDLAAKFGGNSPKKKK